MALSTTFAPGTLQALEAHRYFQKLANERVRAVLSELTPKQYLIEQHGQEDLYLRVWSNGKMPGAKQWVMRIRKLLAAVREVDEAGSAPDALFQLLRSCTADGNGFVEVLGDDPFTEEEQLALTLGMENGRAVLLSAPRLICVELHDGLYGLAVHDRGSWLLEETDGAARITVARDGTMD